MSGYLYYSFIYYLLLYLYIIYQLFDKKKKHLQVLFYATKNNALKNIQEK